MATTSSTCGAKRGATMNRRSWDWATLGWVGVWLLFIVFHVLYFTNHMEGLLWVTLLSVGPLWVLTAMGGLYELRGILARFASNGSREEEP